MSEINPFEEIERKILTIRGQHAVLDSDVAQLYGVETRAINQAVRNNPDKFLSDYIFSLSQEEWDNLKSNFLTSSWGGKHKLPKAFTEKGLYMLATILKGSRATETTIAIVETFAKIRELGRVIKQLPDIEDKSRQKSLMQKSGELIGEILDNNALETTADETTIELNFALVKIKHTTKRSKKPK